MRRQRFHVQLIASWLVFATGCEREPLEEAPVRVEGGEPVVRSIDVTLRYPLELMADETVSIAPVLARGLLTRVLVDVGDKVKAGQLVATLDCREYAAQGAQVAKAISQREAQVEESRKLLDRLLVMNEQQLIAPAELDRARAAYRVAEAQLDEAKARLSEASQRQGYCSLKAPFDGYVSARKLDPGAMVAPGEAVATIVKTRAVTAVASVIEQDVAKVQPAAEATITLHAFPDQKFRGKVARVGRALNPSTRTLPIEIDIPNGAGALLPGMTGRVEIVTGRHEDAILLPVTALLNLEEASYAFLARKQEGETRAHRVEVELGVDLGDWVEIRKGLSADDRVIMVGRELVAEGSLVELSEPKLLPDLPDGLSEEPADEEVEAKEASAGSEQAQAGSESPVRAGSRLTETAVAAVAATKAKAQAPSEHAAQVTADRRAAAKTAAAKRRAAKKRKAEQAGADDRASDEPREVSDEPKKKADQQSSSSSDSPGDDPDGDEPNSAAQPASQDRSGPANTTAAHP